MVKTAAEVVQVLSEKKTPVAEPSVKFTVVFEATFIVEPLASLEVTTRGSQIPDMKVVDPVTISRLATVETANVPVVSAAALSAAERVMLSAVLFL